jgi:hypothetical protein
MKQLDLIVSAACIVIGFVVVLILISTRRQPVMAPSVPKINTVPVELKSTPVEWSNGLPGAPGGGMGPGGGNRKGGFIG